MTDDPYTMAARLCDDDGNVSAARHPGPFQGSYLDFLHHLRTLTARGRGEKAPDRISEPFPCTGHAHLAGEHIRCTSPAHQAPQAQSFVLSGSPSTVFALNAPVHAAKVSPDAIRRRSLGVCEAFLASRGGKLTAEELLAFAEAFNAS